MNEMKVALFAPCYVNQLYPQVAIAALSVLERLGMNVTVPDAAVCCGQPTANAGFEHDGDKALEQLVKTFDGYDRVVALSGSCAVHVRAHARASVAERTVEFTSFLHDDVSVEAVSTLGVAFPKRVGMHVGCHGLRSLGIARPTEIQSPSFNKLRALLATVSGLTFAELKRPDECCGFGGTFSVSEPDISAKMGRDRLRDYVGSGVEAVVSTDVSCLMHMGGLANRNDVKIPMLHVAQVLNER